MNKLILEIGFSEDGLSMESFYGGHRYPDIVYGPTQVHNKLLDIISMTVLKWVDKFRNMTGLVISDPSGKDGAALSKLLDRMEAEERETLDVKGLIIRMRMGGTGWRISSGSPSSFTSGTSASAERSTG